MARQLKRWESPRQEGRNTKGKGGSARQRQRRKQLQRLRQKLKDTPNRPDSNAHYPQGGSSNAPPIFWSVLCLKACYRTLTPSGFGITG